jgi:Xaa-Pro aminopeptidase
MREDRKIFNEQRLREMMEREGIDLLILRTPENSKYISEYFHGGGKLGYRPFVVFYFLDPEKKPAMIVPAVDLHLAMEMTWIEDVRAYQMAELFTDIEAHFYEDFFEAAQDVLKDRNVKGMVIGTEGEELSSGYRKKLEVLLEGNTIVDAYHKLGLVRMVKTSEEIRRLRKATEVTVKAHESFRNAIRPGASDWDLHRAAALRMIDEGADTISFIYIGAGDVSFAAHSRFPRGHILKEGDFVKVDMGAQYMDYPADFVRSYYLGSASQRAKDIWKWLNECQLALGEWIQPGVTGGEIFQKAYADISKHLDNYPREFFGHGLGLSPHEQPRMNKVNKTVLEPNSVLCLETSYYFEGNRFHSEETYLLKEGVKEHWTAHCPRDLIVPI